MMNGHFSDAVEHPNISIDGVLDLTAFIVSESRLGAAFYITCWSDEYIFVVVQNSGTNQDGLL